jgi:Fe-S cluster assembly protein SufD
VRGVAAELAFERSYEAARRGRSERAPVWLERVREEAWQAFAERGLPTRRDEDWRFTSLAPLEGLDFAAPQPGEVPAEQLAAARERVDSALLLVISNGQFRHEQSQIGGLSVESLDGAMSTGRLGLGSVLDPKRSPLSALNTALQSGGVFLEIAATQVESAAIHVLHWLDGGAPQAVNPRVHVVVRAGASATLVEHFVGASGSRGFSNSGTELVVERDARLRYVQVQEFPESAFHVSSLATHQATGSRVELASIALGGRLARVEIRSALSGERAELEVNGLYLGRGVQHQDHHTTIDHAAPRTTSRELFKGMLDGRAHGVFHGRVHVRPHAQKIDAAQTNRTLLLSDGAVIDSKPQLEIFADDVKCSHGASIGQLDPDQIFYLRARGLDLERARALLSFAFASELLAKLPLETLRESLERTLLAWLPLGAAS